MPKSESSGAPLPLLLAGAALAGAAVALALSSSFSSSSSSSSSSVSSSSSSSSSPPPPPSSSSPSSSSTEIEKLKARCEAERRGRINAEIAHRTALKAHSSSSSSSSSNSSSSNSSAPCHSDSLTLLPIGHVTSPFVKRTGCPRQPCLCPSALGQITLSPAVAAESLDGLTEYSYIWVIFTFHANTDLPRSTSTNRGSNALQQSHPFASAKSKILPPRCPSKRGIFATRSPHRYNNVGLSLLKLRSVKGRTVTVEGIDLCDGTPVYDIKPYIPWDVPGYTEGGFGGFDVERYMRCPEWVYDEMANEAHRRTKEENGGGGGGGEKEGVVVDTGCVRWSEEAAEDLQRLHGKGVFAPLYKKGDEEGMRMARKAVSEVLKQDPRNKRAKVEDVRDYSVVFCEAKVTFRVEENKREGGGEGGGGVVVWVKKLEKVEWGEEADGVKLLKREVNK